MGEINLLNKYPKTKRNIESRHVSQSKEKDVAMQFGREYFDGAREQGYGGYKYDGRWLPVAETFVKHWSLKPGDKVLDVGCAKGFLVHDLMKICPGLEVYGVDISNYAVENAMPSVRDRLSVASAVRLPFSDKSFKAVISINTIHNLEENDCITALQELERVALYKYVQVDSYLNSTQKQDFLKWVLTAKTHHYPQEWEALFERAGYTGDYYWTITE